MKTTAPAVRPQIPYEIKVELYSRKDGFLPRMTQIINSVAAKASEESDHDDDPTLALENVKRMLAGGEALVVHARLGRTLVGFLVLDSSNGAAPFSWVDRHYRNCGLGERFYSFACINLARHTPEFTFHKDMLEEYGAVLKSAGVTPKLRNSFYVVHERGATTASNANKADKVEPLPAAGTPAAVESGGQGVVIKDGQWVGFSRHDARRLKLPGARIPRAIEP